MMTWRTIFYTVDECLLTSAKLSYRCNSSNDIKPWPNTTQEDETAHIGYKPEWVTHFESPIFDYQRSKL